MDSIFLGLGSNLGQREDNLRQAIKLLEKNGVSVRKSSTFIETDPVGGPPAQGKYINAVIEVRTGLDPYALLDLCKRIEKQMGRAMTVINGPRLIDIDILLYKDHVAETETLRIPHPRMFERDFVLKPLREIAPQISQESFYADH